MGHCFREEDLSLAGSFVYHVELGRKIDRGNQRDA